MVVTLLLLVSAWLVVVAAAAAFTTTTQQSHLVRHQHGPCHASSSSSSFESLEELDQARQRFEAMFAGQQQQQQQQRNSNHKNDKRNHKNTLLSSTSRRRREIEINLLQSLSDSDDAIDELVNLWMTERGPECARILQDMQESCSDGLVQEEATMRYLLLQQQCNNDDDWYELSFRLATLLYYKGQTDESKYLCVDVVLRHKPWHFEAAHLAMLLAFREQNECEIWKWARERLPPLYHCTEHEQTHHPSKRRQQWVLRAVTRARQSLEQAESELRLFQQQQQYQQSSSSSSNLLWTSDETTFG